MAFGTGSFGFFSAGLGGPPPPGTGGIYGGSGTVPTAVDATVTDDFRFVLSSGSFYVRNSVVGEGIKLQVTTVDAVRLTTTSGTNGIIQIMGSGFVRAQIGQGSAFFGGNGGEANYRMTIGDETDYPTHRVHITGQGSTSGTHSLYVENSLGVGSMMISDDGLINCKMDAGTGSQFILGSSATNITTFSRTSTTSHLFQMNSSGSAFIYFRNTFCCFPRPHVGWEGVKIGGATTAPDASAIFELDDITDSKGFLPPRNTDPATNIPTPADGLIAYDSTDNKLQYYDSASWVTLGATELLVANTLYVDGTNGDDDTAVSGDMSKPYATITGLAGANVSAGVGDLIHIRPGTYVENDILKDGVAYYFDKGAIFHPTSVQQDADNAAILTAEAYTHKVIVLGYGEFISDYAAGGISNACIRIISDNAYLEFFQCTWTGGSGSGGQKGVVYLNCTGTGFDNLIELNGNVTKTTDTGGSGGNGWYCVFIIGGLNYKINGVFTNLSNANNSCGILINGGSLQNVQCTGRIFVSATTATCYGLKSNNNYTTFSWSGDIEIETHANGYALYADTGYSGECLARGTFRGAIYCGMGGLGGKGMYISGLQVVTASPSGYAFKLDDGAFIVVDLVIESSIDAFEVTEGAILFQGVVSMHSDQQRFLTQSGGKFVFNGMMEKHTRRLENSTITGGECVIQSDYDCWGSNYPNDEYLFYVDGGILRVEGCKIQNNQITNGSGVIEYVSGQLILNGAVLVSTAVDVTTFSIKVISALDYIAYNDSYANMAVGGGGSLTNLITGGGSIVVDTDVE